MTNNLGSNATYAVLTVIRKGQQKDINLLL